MAALEFRTIEPKIRYFGTPVALISSLNEDGATNLAPMSSFWALGGTLVLGVLDETRVQHLHRISGAKLEQLGGGIVAEVEIVRLHVATDFVLGDRYIDAVKWSPLIYNFRHYFRLAEHELGKTFRAER
jgi:flavin reductase (DIM6/NTAB) family NADH-FMN oxidoreductase RutF